MRPVREMIALLMGLAVLSLPVSAQAAASYAADLDPAARAGHAEVGGVAQVLVAIHNHGPNPTEPGNVVVEITAPGGTVFGPEMEKRSTSSLCKLITAHKRANCQVNGQLYVDGHGPGGEPAPQWGPLDFTVVSACTTPGRIRVVYRHDTKPSNNTATMTVKADGVEAKPCAKASASASPSPRPSPSGSPSPSASALPVTGEPSAEPTVVPAQDTPVVPVSDSSALSTGFIIGGLVMLVGVALLAGIYLYNRRQGDEDEGFEA